MRSGAAVHPNTRLYRTADVCDALGIDTKDVRALIDMSVARGIDVPFVASGNARRWFGGSEAWLAWVSRLRGPEPPPAADERDDVLSVALQKVRGSTSRGATYIRAAIGALTPAERQWGPTPAIVAAVESCERVCADVRKRQGLSDRDLLTQGWVYFIQAATGVGPIKIGIANDLPNRMQSLCYSAPVQLRLLGARNSTRMVEPFLHLLFDAHRMHGEWFAPCALLVTNHRRALDARLGAWHRRAGVEVERRGCPSLSGGVRA